MQNAIYDLPSYVWALVLVGVIGLPAATIAALYRGAVAVGASHRAAIILTAATATLMVGWLVVSGSLANANLYQQQPGQVVPWLVVVFAGTLVGLLLATRIPIVSRILAEPGTLTRLTLPHTFRVAGVLFLIVMALDYLPAIFALPAGLGDIAIGISAPFVARRLSRDTGRAAAVRFNVLGIIDLLVAAGLGFLLFGFIDVTPSTVPLRLLPLALVPTVPVPLAIALHVVSLWRLRAAQPENDRGEHLLSQAAAHQDARG